MDALTHAIEGLITLGAWEMSDMLELKAIEMIAKWLPKAVETPSDIEARDAIATAQYIAGMAFSNVGLGLVHGMAHPLGALLRYSARRGQCAVAALCDGIQHACRKGQVPQDRRGDGCRYFEDE